MLHSVSTDPSAQGLLVYSAVTPLLEETGTAPFWGKSLCPLTAIQKQLFTLF